MTRIARLVAAVLISVLDVAALVAAQQAPAPVVGTGAISGVVVDGETGRPLAGAVVYLGPPQRASIGQPLREVTDSKGRFVFTDLAPQADGYFINASKFGYAEGHYGKGAGGALGARIFIGDGDWFADARVAMYRPGAIGGAVSDEHGEPVVGAYVRALVQVFVAGTAHWATGPIARTDDRGSYRIANLAPGKYAIGVPSVQATVPTLLATPATPPPPGSAPQPSPEPALDLDATTRLVIGRYPVPPAAANGRPQAYAPVFYPNASTVAQGQLIDVRFGDDRTGIDLRLQPVPVSRVSGTIAGPLEAAKGLTVRLLAAGAEELGQGSETATALVNADGAFTFANVPPGGYTIEARRTVSEYSLRYDTVNQPPGVRLPDMPGFAVGGSGTASVDFGSYGLYMEYRSPQGGSDLYIGRMHVDVGTVDVRGVVVPMQRAVSISGRFVIETSSAAPATAASPLLGFSAQADPANGSLAAGAPRSVTARNGDPTVFKIDGVAPGQYYLRFASTPRSIMWNGRDMTNAPFDVSGSQDIADVIVTVSDQHAVLTGTVRGADGQVARDAVVLAYPVERDQWTNYGTRPIRIRANPAGTNGTFRYQSLPAGDYFVIAVDGSRSDSWTDPKFLAAASALAARVTLEWGATKTIDVKLLPASIK